MKVLFITRKFPPSVGGMEQFAFGLTQAYPSAKIWKWGGANWNLIWWLPLTKIRLCLGKSADVVHLMDGVLVILAPVARWFGRRVVVTIHGLEVTYKNPVYQKLFLFGLKQVHGIVSVSSATAQLVEQFAASHHLKLGAGGIAHTIISHGTSTPTLLRAEAETWIADRFAIQIHHPVVLLAGRLVKRKGQAWFLEQVASQLLKDPTARVVVVGTGPEQTTVQFAADKLGHLASQVLLRGRVSDQELAAWYARANVMVMPNLPVAGDAEGFGIVALEARSYGCPVVASRLEGITDAVTDGISGRLVTPGDALAFSNAIQDVLTWTAEKRQAIAQEVAQKHTWGQVAEEYRTFFQTLT